MCDRTVDFSVLCNLLEAVVRSKKAAMKCKHIRTFLDHVYTDREFLSAIRLVLPHLDRERGTYGLKEAILAKCLGDALRLSRDSEDAQKLVNWRKGGTRAGNNAGNFPLVAAEVLYRRQRTSSGGLKIKDVNDYLDRLATVESREEKTAVLAEIINKTNAQEMKWIIMFILKDVKLGIGEKTIFHQLHPDAEDLFNVTCDLKLVCEKLKDRNQRYKRQDIEVGKPVRPQLASRIADVDEAWKKLRGKQVVVECKFDGDRIQLHKDGTDLHFFSRNFIDHMEFKEGIASVIVQQVRMDKCILDGEMLVWNRATNRFAEFGSNQMIAKAAKEGLETDQQLCYVVFDILYAGDSSVIHRSLRERKEILRKVVHPLKGRLEIVLPETNSNYLPNEPRWSVLAQSAEDVKKFFQETVENRDEGVVIKDLDSKWEPSDRSGKWFKLKPDYVHTGSDLDALIIGGYFGSGRRGGEVAQFLLGIADKPKSGGNPTRFLSFCKVGSGISDEELQVLASKLKPYFRMNDKNTKTPGFYVVTNSAKERPDVWIEQPEKSVILEITSDIRTIKSEVFAAPYSLRFPRVNRVRYDKPWYDCLSLESLVEIVHVGSGSTADGKQQGSSIGRKGARNSKKEVRPLSLVPSHMVVTDVSSVTQETSIFKGLVFYVINVDPQNSKDRLHKLVVENGGSFSMNMNDTVTHAIAAEKKGIRYQAATLHGDIIHVSWFLDCCRQKVRLPLRPKYILHLSDTSNTNTEEMDEFGDHFYWDIDVEDLRQLFQNRDVAKYSAPAESIHHYQEKYCQAEDLCYFSGCHLYFLHPIHSVNSDSQVVAEITLKRLQLECSMHGGKEASSLRNATHVIVYMTLDNVVSFSNIFNNVERGERKFLKSRKINVVSQTWVEDCLENCKRLPEENYTLRDVTDLDSHEEQQLPLADRSNEKRHVQESNEHAKSSRRTRCSRRRSALIHENDGMTSESDEIAPRRQLYVDIPSSSQQQVGEQDKEKDSGRKLKGRSTSRKRKTDCCIGETEDVNMRDCLPSFSVRISANEAKKGRKDSSRIAELPRTSTNQSMNHLQENDKEEDPNSMGNCMHVNDEGSPKVAKKGKKNCRRLKGAGTSKNQNLIDYSEKSDEGQEDVAPALIDDHANMQAGKAQDPAFEVKHVDSTANCLEAILLDMVPSFDGFQRTSQSKSDHASQIQGNFESLTNSSLRDGLHGKVSPPPKKTKVSYRSLVENLLNE